MFFVNRVRTSANHNWNNLYNKDGLQFAVLDMDDKSDYTSSHILSHFNLLTSNGKEIRLFVTNELETKVDLNNVKNKKLAELAVSFFKQESSVEDIYNELVSLRYINSPIVHPCS